MTEQEITKEELKKLKEEDLMFITNPGRMGDVDGSTFIIKKENDYIMYRVGGWYSKDPIITMDELFEVFPKWKESLYHASDKNYKGKYTYLYMGFGNGLCIDKSIYDEFYPYLLEEVKKQDMYEEINNEYNPCLNYPSWIPALEHMIKDNSLAKR